MRIGLFLNYLDEEYQLSVYKGIRAEAAALSLDLICIQGETLYNYREESTEGPFPSREYIGADGLLLLSSAIMDRSSFTPLPSLKKFIKVPLVSIGSRFPDCPSIVVRNRESMTLLMEHLIQLHGYRKLLYIGGPVQHPDNLVREHVFRRTINALKKTHNGLEGTIINGEFHQTSAIMMLRKFIDAHPGDPPEAIVAANDNLALGAMELLRSQNDPRWRNCPVTGFDDIAQARLDPPALTTVRQPLEEMGALAVRCLWDLMSGREVSPVIYVESELRIRNSCGCAPLCGVFDSNRHSREAAEVDTGMACHERKAGIIAEPETMSEYHLQNVSLLGHALVAINSLDEMLPHLNFFLTNLMIKTFYLILYPKPLNRIGNAGILLYVKKEHTELIRADYPEKLKMNFFLSNIDNEKAMSKTDQCAWCVYYLRSGREYLGLIVYEAPDRVHPQICSAAVFIANTVKRLQVHDDEKEQSLRLEKEVAIRTRDLKEEIRRRMALEAEVLRISEMERLRFSMDLHDDICQRLAGISMFSKSFMQGVSPQTFLPELSELIDETLARTRRYAHDSFPMELDTLGLKEALNALCHTVKRQNNCKCLFTWLAPEKSPFSNAQDLNIYRIVQEALQNAVKHAKADRITVQVQLEQPGLLKKPGQLKQPGQKSTGEFSVSIQDNGTGNNRLNEKEPDFTDIKRYIKSGGLGLHSMRYRAHQLGGQFTIESSDQNGTRVELRIGGL